MKECYINKRLKSPALLVEEHFSLVHFEPPQVSFPFQLREFDTHQQDTGSWFTDLQTQVDSLKSQSEAEDRLHSAQVS